MRICSKYFATVKEDFIRSGIVNFRTEETGSAEAGIYSEWISTIIFKNNFLRMFRIDFCNKWNLFYIYFIK